MQHKLQDLCKNLPSTTPKIKLNDTKQKKNNQDSSKLFTESLSHFATGLVRVAKDDLMQTFDFGVPPTPNMEDKDVLILYNKKEALPSDKTVARAARLEEDVGGIPFLTARTATENCDTMNVVLINNPGNVRQCMALVGGQYQSYHVQRWMRRDKHGGLNPSFPLTLTSR